MYVIGSNTLFDILLDQVRGEGLVVDGIFDDFTKERSVRGVPVIGPTSMIWQDLEAVARASIFVAIGDNVARRDFTDRLLSSGVEAVNVVHPGAHVEPTAIMGHGNLVMAGCYVGSHVRIGNANVVFPGACIAHHNTVGDGCFLAPNVSIGGFSRIGALCKIGMNSVVAPYITLPEGFQCGPLSLVEQPPMD